MKKTIRRVAFFGVLGGLLALGTYAHGEEPDQRELFREGAKLWPQTCATCHNARPGSDRSPAEWDIVMMHMRTVANLPEAHAQAILAYLKAR